MHILISLLLNGIAIFVTAYILPGIHINNFFTAIVAGVVLGVLNTFLKPLLILLSLPINILTLGLFIFVINAALVLLAQLIVPGFVVDGFLWALIFSLVLSIINAFINRLKTN